MKLEQRDTTVLIDGMPAGVRISSLSGLERALDYTTLEAIGSGTLRGVLRGRLGDLDYRLEDRWSPSSRGLRLTRELQTGSTGSAGGGLAFELTIALPAGRYRYFVPAACYDYSPIEGPSGQALICEERMAAPLVMAYDEASRSAIVLLREAQGGSGRAGGPARWSRPADRKRGQTRFLQETEIGSLGYRRAIDDLPACLVAAIPRRETPASRMIDRSLSPFAAYLPPGRRAYTLTYRLARLEADGSGGLVGGAGGPRGPGGFDAACLQAYALAASVADLEPVEPPGGLRGCLQARLEALSELAIERTGFTALNLNFDPRESTASPPSGYGTSFNKLAHEIYPDILEYGFTGRQLNNAYLLALAGGRWKREGWIDSASRIVSSYLRSCVAKSGFLYTLYDIGQGRALNPLGDPVGSRLHYGAQGAEEGNYIRNMAEAATDLCLFSSAALREECLGAARAFGDFLLRAQNRDGSWYRAYTPDGRAIMKPEEWFGGSERANRSSTSTVIPFLTELARRTGESAYRKAALRAGEWLLAEVVERIDYRGGTLDNPNVVDKEGMAYAMSALLRLHEATGAREFLDGARSAGGLALTWNWLWDVPFEEGTRLAEQAFSSRGWGGISILWGAGVVDIYSLWFLADWKRLGELTQTRLFGEVARLILYGTQQMLSLPERSVGLVTTGLQEEGFAASDQGVDEGMIAKGSTWGSLGWVFGAGTYPVWLALEGEGSLG